MRHTAGQRQEGLSTSENHGCALDPRITLANDRIHLAIGFRGLRRESGPRKLLNYPCLKCEWEPGQNGSSPAGALNFGRAVG